MHKAFLYKRIWFIAIAQVAIVVTSFALAFALRFDFDVPPRYVGVFLAHLPVLLLIKLSVFRVMGLFRGWWRYVSMADLLTILKANLVSSAAFLAYIVFVHRLGTFPRSVLVLDGVFCFLLMGGVRFVTRALRENYLSIPFKRSQLLTRVLVVGAGDAGQAIAREVRQSTDLDMRIVGYVDDDKAKQNQDFQGFCVLGAVDDVGEVCRRHKVDEVIIAIPSASRKQVRSIVDRCLEAGVRCKSLPSIRDLIDGKVSVQQVKEVDVQGLLGREPVVLDNSGIARFLEGKCVLVTGAAGSIGSELCRQVGLFRPRKIVLLENAESPLFGIDRELRYLFPQTEVVAVLGDIRNRARIVSIFEKYRPQIVFHAAAYKHVPMMEENPAEAAENNVRGTRVVADAARMYEAEGFVLVSTDKAVKPRSVMGATKRAAEIYVQALACTSKTRFVTVRFGNVLDSAGSVVPIFKDQIRKGGPVQVTHPEVTRYFMTIPEASQLVLQAASMGEGGEVFILDMGVPVRIVELAEELIRLSGFQPNRDVDIVFTGLRPGEKLTEELHLPDEGCLPTRHPKIQAVRGNDIDLAAVNETLDRLYQSSRQLDAGCIRRILGEIVAEYNPLDGTEA